jgi:hypothetical protein
MADSRESEAHRRHYSRPSTRLGNHRRFPNATVLIAFHKSVPRTGSPVLQAWPRLGPPTYEEERQAPFKAYGENTVFLEWFRRLSTDSRLRRAGRCCPRGGDRRTRPGPGRRPRLDLSPQHRDRRTSGKRAGGLIGSAICRYIELPK